MTTKQKHTQLKNLAKDAKQNLYEMIKLAEQIISDHEYVDELGGEDVVLEMLQADEFSHFGTSFTVGSMIAAYRANPDLKTWKHYKFDIQAMIDLTKPTQEPSGEPAVRTDWKGKALDLESENEALEAAIETLETEVEELRQRNSELSREVAELTGELRGLTKKFQAA